MSEKPIFEKRHHDIGPGHRLEEIRKRDQAGRLKITFRPVSAAGCADWTPEEVIDAGMVAARSETRRMLEDHA